MKLGQVLRLSGLDGRSMFAALSASRHPLALKGQGSRELLDAIARYDRLVPIHGRRTVLNFYRSSVLPALQRYFPGPERRVAADARIEASAAFVALCRRAIDDLIQHGPMREALPWAEEFSRRLPDTLLDDDAARNAALKREARDALRAQLATIFDNLRDDFDGALRTLRIIRELGSLNLLQIHHYARLMQRSGDGGDEAVRAYLRARESDGGDPELDAIVESSLHIDDATPRTTLPGRLMLNQRVLIGRPGWEPPATNAGIAYLRLDAPDKALPYLEAADANPGASSRASFYLAQALFRLGAFDRALPVFERAAARGVSRSRLAARQAVALAKTGRIEPAFETFKIAERELDQDAGSDFFFEWGRVCLGMGLTHDAEDRFRRALERNRNDWNAWNGLAVCKARTGAAAEGARILQERLHTHGQDAPAASAYLLGRLLLDDGRIVQAIPHLQQACKTAPDNAAYALQLGAALYDSGAAAASIACLEQGAHAGLGGPEAVRRIGLHHYDLGQPEQARIWLQRLLELAPAAVVRNFVERCEITRAVNLFNAGDYASAATVLQELSGDAADHADVRSLLAQALTCDAALQIKADERSDIRGPVAAAGALAALPETVFLAAFLDLAEGYYAEAEARLEALVRQHPEREHYVLFHALARLLAGNGGEAPAASAAPPALLAFMEVYGSAGRGDYGKAADKLLDWMQYPEDVRNTGLSRRDLNLFVFAILRAGASRPARIPGQLAKLNKDYGDNYWDLAGVLMQHYDAARKGPQNPDRRKIAECEDAYAALLERADGEERRAILAYYTAWQLFLVRWRLHSAEYGEALEMLDRLETAVGALPRTAAGIRERLQQKMAPSSHEKALYLLERDRAAARRVWEDLLAQNGEDTAALGHLACMAWSDAHDAALDGRHEEALPHWKSGIGYYKRLYDQPEYWEYLREKGRKLAHAGFEFDEPGFERWRQSALHELAETLLDQILHLIVLLGESRSVRTASAIMDILYSSQLGAEIEEGLSRELARRRLDPDPSRLADFEAARTRAHSVINIDKRNAAARRFLMQAVSCYIQNGGLEEPFLKRCKNLIEQESAHAQWLYEHRDRDAASREDVQRELTGFYHEAGNVLHNLGQIEVRRANEHDAVLKDAIARGQGYIDANFDRLKGLQDERNRCLERMKQHYRESDTAFRRALELDPLDVSAQELVDWHKGEYR